MFYRFLLVLLILDALILCAAVLLQSGKGGGLAASFGGASSSSDALFGTRQAGNLLTKASWWCGGLFMGIAFVLQIIGTHSRAPTSVLDKSFSAPVNAPAPATPQTAPATAPAVPLQTLPQAQTGTKPAGGTKAPEKGAAAPPKAKP